MSYLVTIFDHKRERVKQRKFQFRHEAMGWLVLSGFITEDLQHPYTHEYAEITREIQTC